MAYQTRPHRCGLPLPRAVEGRGVDVSEVDLAVERREAFEVHVVTIAGSEHAKTRTSLRLSARGKQRCQAIAQLGERLEVREGVQVGSDLLANLVVRVEHQTSLTPRQPFAEQKPPRRHQALATRRVELQPQYSPWISSLRRAGNAAAETIASRSWPEHGARS
jgi:hypothetical protein